MSAAQNADVTNHSGRCEKWLNDSHGLNVQYFTERNAEASQALLPICWNTSCIYVERNDVWEGKDKNLETSKTLSCYSHVYERLSLPTGYKNRLVVQCTWIIWKR